MIPHTPVLLDECLEGLNIKPDGVYVDGSVGYGGHSAGIANKLTTGRLIAIDRDAGALRYASGALGAYTGKITFVHGNFGDISRILDENDAPSADGMIYDFGVSSPQLDDPGRGFSYMNDAPLDMRMNLDDELTAFDIVNGWSENRLRTVFYEFGEERYAGLIARAIVRKRAAAPIKTTFDLNGIILSAIPAQARREAQHPSKRCFQALRITTNDELGSIARMLDTAPDRLKPGGRICVICFHSLEEKLCKHAFMTREKGCICPKDFPVCVCGIAPTLKIITRKAITPSETEVANNPRARSGKLRIAERV